LAVNTTVDNAVIDYTAIASLLQTVKSHDDLFVQFSSGSLGNIATDTLSGGTVTTSGNPIPASSFLMQGAQINGTLTNGNAVVKVLWGQAFGGTPIVTATPVMTPSTASPSTYIQSIDGTTGATIVINNNDSATKTAAFTLQVLALGVRAS